MKQGASVSPTWNVFRSSTIIGPFWSDASHELCGLCKCKTTAFSSWFRYALISVHDHFSHNFKCTEAVSHLEYQHVAYYLCMRFVLQWKYTVKSLIIQKSICFAICKYGYKHCATAEALQKEYVNAHMQMFLAVQQWMQLVGSCLLYSIWDFCKFHSAYEGKSLHFGAILICYNRWNSSFAKKKKIGFIVKIKNIPRLWELQITLSTSFRCFLKPIWVNWVNYWSEI